MNESDNDMENHLSIDVVKIPSERMRAKRTSENQPSNCEETPFLKFKEELNESIQKMQRKRLERLNGSLTPLTEVWRSENEKIIGQVKYWKLFIYLLLKILYSK